MSKQKTMILLVGFTLLLFLIGLIIPPIPQPQSYHDFADQRSFLGIANAWNVLSNIPFALVGCWGLILLLSPNKVKFVSIRERWPWIGVAIGLIITALGSGYYHLAPDNYRLVWDRLAMSIVFMSFSAALITERIDIWFGLWLWPLLIAFGFYSVCHWYGSEQRSVGDLRLYFGVQLFSFIVGLLMLFTVSPYDRVWDIAVVILLFVLAHLLELYDRQIATFLPDQMSGHTLKHFFGALAGFWLIQMIWKRKIVRNEKGKINAF